MALPIAAPNTDQVRNRSGHPGEALTDALDALAPAVHEHAPSDLPQFNAAVYVKAKMLLVAGANVSLTPDDETETITVGASIAASEWSAETVSQEEAEAGVATTRRAWTAERVAQAIAALAPSGGASWGITTTATSKTLAAHEWVSVTAAGCTITLPATPSAGDACRVSVGAFADTVVARNGQTIRGAADDVTINQPWADVEFAFDGTTWRVF